MTGRPFEHPVTYSARLGIRDGSIPVAELVAECGQCPAWRRATTSSYGREHLDAVTFRHSGMRQCQAPTCRAWIIDARTEAGALTPVDALASPATGNQALRFDPEAKVYRTRTVKPAEDLAEGEVRVMTHFATCTEPERFRRRAS